VSRRNELSDDDVEELAGTSNFESPAESGARRRARATVMMLRRVKGAVNSHLIVMEALSRKTTRLTKQITCLTVTIAVVGLVVMGVQLYLAWRR